MNIHNRIRQEVVELLANAIEDVGYFHNGLPKIDDVENGLPLIAVYLNSAEADPIAIGSIEWQANLSILTYIPFNEGEARLDEISEKINNIILGHSFKHFSIRSDFHQAYEYEYDTENNVWVGSAIDYRIRYELTNMYNFKENSKE
ncbi:phage tail terminator protein [Frederiksenia canicola]|uniref:Minor tail protein U n=1 Tax=Frederiksenia canicola TaxID=123824 RepID=A0AAE6X4Z2_9PAST|nr:phage tail terminator protein [Frederiksenia canicola]QIM64287.1 hypothetical protein A4G17_01870 [Frederiksenia canicola]RPE93832.1 minor tail protein U [Frederiksenia canicola]